MKSALVHHAIFDKYFFKCGKMYKNARVKYSFTLSCNVYRQQSRIANTIQITIPHYRIFDKYSVFLTNVKYILF